MKKNGIHGFLLGLIYRYVIFFLLVAFLVTCSTSLFVKELSEALEVELTRENVGGAAKLTFLNVMVLSVLFCAIDLIRRRLTTDRITKRINEAGRELIRGNYSVRIKPLPSIVSGPNFNEIIDCFNIVAEELGGVESLRSDFIADASHEMKTPLAVIKNYSVLLSEDGLDDALRKEYAENIGQSCERMANMVGNILQLDRLENQKIYPKLKSFDLGAQLGECLLQYEEVREERNIELDVDIEDDVMLEGDEGLLFIVWNNLLSNAFKFTADSGHISVRLRAEGEYAVVTISDDGCGMTPQVGEHIFEKFYQADTSRSSTGNGLGLALVKRVIDICKGEISVESRLGVGTSFTVRLSGRVV